MIFYKGSDLESCLVFATNNLSFFCEAGPRSFCDSFRPFVSFDYVSYQSYLALLMTKGVQHSHWEFCPVITPKLKVPCCAFLPTTVDNCYNDMRLEVTFYLLIKSKHDTDVLWAALLCVSE